MITGELSDSQDTYNVYRSGMDANTIIAASGAILVCVTALLLNYRGFASIDGRFASLERRLEVLERDLRDFYRLHADVKKEIARLKDHTGLR
jgi:hypothetical protein